MIDNGKVADGERPCECQPEGHFSDSFVEEFHYILTTKLAVIPDPYVSRYIGRFFTRWR